MIATPFIVMLEIAQLSDEPPSTSPGTIEALPPASKKTFILLHSAVGNTVS